MSWHPNKQWNPKLWCLTSRVAASGLKKSTAWWVSKAGAFCEREAVVSIGWLHRLGEIRFTCMHHVRTFLRAFPIQDKSCWLEVYRLYRNNPCPCKINIGLTHSAETIGKKQLTMSLIQNSECARWAIQSPGLQQPQLQHPRDLRGWNGQGKADNVVYEQMGCSRAFHAENETEDRCCDIDQIQWQVTRKVGDKIWVLASPIHAPKGSQIERFAAILGPLEAMSHALFWTDEESGRMFFNVFQIWMCSK